MHQNSPFSDQKKIKNSGEGHSTSDCGRDPASFLDHLKHWLQFISRNNLWKNLIFNNLSCLRTHRVEALSDAFVWRLSAVVHIGRNSRTERHRKTKIGTEVTHVTRDSDTTSKVKGQLVADVLNSQHAGTGATWRINTNILSTCRGHIVVAAAYSLSYFPCSSPHDKNYWNYQNFKTKKG